MYKLTWTDAKGRSHLESFEQLADAQKRMKKMRREATLRYGDAVIGGVWRNDGKWTWWTEPPAS